MSSPSSQQSRRVAEAKPEVNPQKGPPAKQPQPPAPKPPDDSTRRERPSSTQGTAGSGERPQSSPSQQQRPANRVEPDNRRDPEHPMRPYTGDDEPQNASQRPRSDDDAESDEEETSERAE